MLKALIKKQFAELLSAMFAKRNARTGKKASPVPYIILFVFLFGYLGYTFFTIAMMFGTQLVEKNLDWLFFAIISTIAVSFGVLGSVFSTYTALYNAKDNEALLSMPIQPWKILLSRMISVYAVGFVYEAIVFIPGSLAYFIIKTPGAFTYISCLVMLFMLGTLVLALTCILGFFVALIATRLKNKSILTVIIFVLLFGVYYVFMFRFQSAMQNFLDHAEQTAENIINSFYPLYIIGRAGKGDIVPLIITVAACAVVTAVIALVLSRTFTKIVTTNKGEKKKVYVEKAYKAKSARHALIMRELKKFTSSPAYMLNCGLGIIIMPIAAVALIIYAPTILVHIPEISDKAQTTVVPMVAAIIIMFLSSMNIITAPSISLEGKNLWLLRSLPVSSAEVLMAKRNTQLYVVSVPAVLLSIVACISLKLGILNLIAIPAIVFFTIMLSANLGLVLNLKHPNLTWTNVNTPIKQSLPVFVMTFVGMLSPMFIIGIYMPFGLIFDFPAWIYIAFVAVIFAVLCLVTTKWINKKGTRILEELQ